MTPEKTAHFVYDVVLLRQGLKRKRQASVSLVSPKRVNTIHGKQGDSVEDTVEVAVDSVESAVNETADSTVQPQDQAIENELATLADSLPSVDQFRGASSMEERAHMVKQRILNSELTYTTVEVWVSAICALYDVQYKNCVNSHRHPREGAVRTILQVMSRLKSEQAVLHFEDKGKSECAT